jgi:phosphoglycerate dehydrogenase-like enzyme
MLPEKDKLTVCFAHPAYQLKHRFERRCTGISCFEVRTQASLAERIGEVDVLVVSGLWRNDLLNEAKKLKLIQSVSAGVDQFSADLLRAHGVRLASARGVNEQAVAEHAIALMLAFYRRLGEARDNQMRRIWRGMISDPERREDELGGKTMLILGLGRIGTRLARLARAFDMRILGIRRNPSAACKEVDSVYPSTRLEELLPRADVVALTCALTEETRNIISFRTLALMKAGAILVNVSRGGCVDEPALIESLVEGHLAGACLDCVVDEPLSSYSPLWGFDNVLITPHSAGETREYEENVVKILLCNLERMWRGEQNLENQVV